MARMETLTLPGVVPLVGDADNQLPPDVVVAVAVNGIAAPPLAVTDKFWADGRPPKLTMLNVSGPGGVTFRVGLLLALSVTGIKTGLFDAPLDVRVIVPV